MTIKHKFIENSLKRGCKSYFNDNYVRRSYMEQDEVCIYSCNDMMNLEQRYLDNLCLYYNPKDKKFFLVAYSDHINDKIDHKPIIKSFNDYVNNGDLRAGIDKQYNVWNLSPYLVDTYGELDDDCENILCVYQELNDIGVLSIKRSIKNFRKSLDLYKTSKSKKIRSLYNQIGTIVLHYNNGHE